MSLLILRCVFIMVASGVGMFIFRITADEMPDSSGVQLMALIGVLVLALSVIGLDMATKKKKLDTISAVYFGLIVGLILTYATSLAVSPLFQRLAPNGEASQLQGGATMVIGIVLCYTCVSLLLQTRNDFRFLIPYVEFAKEVKGLRPMILDTSVVIDGRIADVVETSVLDNELVMPRFAISELQKIADSSDRMRRSRGRRGLDVLNQLQNNPEVDFRIDGRELPEFAGQPVDLKLVALARHLEGKLVTNDYNLNKVAKLHGVPVINLNDLANALKPVFLPGEHLSVKIVKHGEEAGQGVGYLEDGTMVVVESGRDHLHQEVSISVTSVLQTSAGRMIFGRFEGVAQEGANRSNAAEKSQKPSGQRPSK